MTQDAATPIPGFANAHSHAFQRALRGTVERRDPDRTDTFWTWRERMYALANRLDLQALEAVTRACYAECLEAGYTAIGEFHYVHHRPGGAPYDDPVATARAVLRAARQVGVRVTLLWTVYARGGFDAPLTPAQTRFGVASLDDVRRALDALAGAVDGRMSALGLALHSVRAVPPAWLGPLAHEARARGLPLHAHVSEQPAEVAACRQATGLTPVALLAREGVLSPSFTAVHGTWLEDEDVALLASSGATVALCPTTEGNLGDGVPRTRDLARAGVPLAVGSDSHAVLDPFAELRALEYQARAATGTRAVLTDAAGDVAPALLRVGHHAGYASLGLPDDGDQIFLDSSARALTPPLEAASSAGHDVLSPVEWLAGAFTAGHPGLVDRVTVAGEERVRGGRLLDPPADRLAAGPAPGSRPPSPQAR